MDEKILVRIGEETPSDEKMAVRLVEVRHLNPELAEKLDVLDKKIDALSEIDDGLEALKEIKSLLSDFHLSIKSLELNQNDFNEALRKKLSNGIQEEILKLSDRLEVIGEKINNSSFQEEMNRVNEQLGDVSRKIDNDYTQTEIRKISALLDSVSDSVRDIDDKYSIIDSKLNSSNFIQTSLQNEVDKVNGRLEIINSKLNDDQVLFDINRVSEQVEDVNKKFNDSFQYEMNKVSELLSTMTNTLNDIDSKHAGIDNKIDANNVNTADLRYDMDKLFTLIEDKYSDVENKYISLDSKLISNKLGQSEIRHEIEHLSSSISEISDSIHSIKSNGSGMDLDIIRGLVEDLAISVDSLKNVNARDNVEIDTVREMVGDLALSVDSLKSVNAKDNAEIVNVKNMIRDLTLSLDSLGRKNDSLSETITLSSSDRQIMEGRLQAELENLQNMITGFGASKSGDGDVLEKLENIKKSVASSAVKVTNNQIKIDKSIKDFNAYLNRLNSIDYMLRLVQAKNLLKTKKKMPKWARDKKKSIETLITGIEDEVADVLIVNAIPKDGIDAASLSREIGRAKKKTTERLSLLLASGYIEERTVKRKKIYFLVA